MKKIVVLTVLAALFYSAFAQSHISTQAHQEQVTAIVPVKGSNSIDYSYFTASDDGFVIKWSEDGQGEHYQFSDVSIKLIACAPNGHDIAIYETDGGSVNKVSVWDWTTFTRKYQKKFSDSITSLAFSAKGTYLIIGTATVDGAIFIKTNGWSVINKIKENTSIVNYITTTATEKTCAFYSPSGTISFYNLENGALKNKFNITKGLSQGLMYNENRYFAGVRDNTIYITSLDKIIASVKANNPIIISDSKDYNLYYVEYDGKNTYEIKMIENLDNNTVSNPRLVKSLKGPRGNQAICVAKKDALNIYFGSKNGALFKTSSEPSVTTESLSELTENQYAKIFDMSPAEEDFYFITASSIYKSSYDTGIVSKMASTSGETNILSYKDNNVILWTKNGNSDIKIFDFDKKISNVLFKPKAGVQVLRLCSYDNNDYLIDIESDGTVNLFDIENSELKEIYSGTGVQDAVLTKDGNLYIAKSSATNPQVPLLCINPQTLETVPLKIKGNVAYAFSTDGKIIYGINVISDETGRNTYVFSYNVETKQMVNMLKFADEDPEAFTYLNGSNLFTNIGKNKVYCYNIPSKKRFAYNRSASIPKSICQNKKRAVILNNNGSISWCNTTDSKLLADWYLTVDEQWYEF